MNSPGPHYFYKLLEKRLIQNDGCLCASCKHYRYQLYIENLRLACPERIYNEPKQTESTITVTASSALLSRENIGFELQIVDEPTAEPPPKPVELEVEPISEEELHQWKMRRLYGPNWKPEE